MSQRIYFIHSVSNLYGLFNELCSKHLPDAQITHLSDESLIQRALKAGGLTPGIIKRVCEHVTASEENGADVIQVTCSSLSPAVKTAQQLVAIPVLTVDEPVARVLVEKYQHIGVIATASSTLDASVQMVKNMALLMNKNVKVTPVFCEGAYGAFFRGDLKRHDDIVLGKLRELMARVDAVLLAQVSMARIASLLGGDEKQIPVETSPEHAVIRLKEVLNTQVRPA
jgi:Asp/Glu/hydantoin racemase